MEVTVFPKILTYNMTTTIDTLFINSHDEGNNGLDLNVSNRRQYCQLIPKLENIDGFCSDFSILPVEEARKSKKVRQNDQDVSSRICRVGSSSSSMLQFMDYLRDYSQRFLAMESMNEAAAALMCSQGDELQKDEGITSWDDMKLVQQLVSCAEAVACRDKTHASTLLSDLTTKALVLGTSFQRVASCFVQGLSNRLEMVQPLGAIRQFARTAELNAEKEEALRLVYDICPYIQFAHYVANAMILEAFEGESSVHVVDMGMSHGLLHGLQWRCLIHSLANRVGNPVRKLRITCVSSDRNLQTVAKNLESYAETLGMNFELLVVNDNLENLKAEDFGVVQGEALVINSVLQLHCVVKESRGALNSVLQMLHSLSPKVLILVEQDASHNGPFFLGRFMESLHYYSAIFDSLDTMLPRYDTRRAKVEQFYFADEINNIVSCEGPARVERHERSDQWRRRMSRAGFQSVYLKMVNQAKQWLGKRKVWEGHSVVEEKGCLILGWNLKPIIAVSGWKCS